jgi:hypothetical protein
MTLRLFPVRRSVGMAHSILVMVPCVSTVVGKPVSRIMMMKSAGLVLVCGFAIGAVTSIDVLVSLGNFLEQLLCGGFMGGHVHEWG